MHGAHVDLYIKNDEPYFNSMCCQYLAVESGNYNSKADNANADSDIQSRATVWFDEIQQEKHIYVGDCSSTFTMSKRLPSGSVAVSAYRDQHFKVNW